jgi:hypothetical protein
MQQAQYPFNLFYLDEHKPQGASQDISHYKLTDINS